MDDSKLIRLLAVPFAVLLIVVALWGIPVYKVWQQGQSGHAELARAEANRKIKIAEAEAAKESAVALAEAEIIRAKGVAEANRIIGDSLRNNEAYLRYLYVQSLADNNSQQVIYVPTEAGLPILEAGKRGEKR
jgi:regulator of protease activity HflC (stomatin/prohibitin superfamily)